MTEVQIKVVNYNGEIILNMYILNTCYLNKIFNKLYKFYFHCYFELVYNNKRVFPLDNINNVSSESIIIFNIVSYFKSNFNSYVAVNDNGKIIDWLPEYRKHTYNHGTFHFLKDYLNSNYDCLDIVSICCNSAHIAILFENSLAIILRPFSNKIIKSYQNATKIIKTFNEIGIIINNNKLITCNYDNKIFETDDLNNLDYKYIYANNTFFFVIGHHSITIVLHMYYLDSIQLITKYEITDILHLEVAHLLPLIAAIKEDSSLISFEIKKFNNNLSIKPLEAINKKSLKIKKILNIDNSFVAITYDDIIFIWGHNKELVDFYDVIQNDLICIDDIVVTKEYIGILKKNNSIIIISVINPTYAIYGNDELDYKYIKIIATNYKIFGLTDDYKVYEIVGVSKSIFHIPKLNNIENIYSNDKDILAISYDNIVYAYKQYYESDYSQATLKMYYCNKILDFKHVRINHNTFIIVTNTYELIEITYNETISSIVKLIEI